MNKFTQIIFSSLLLSLCLGTPLFSEELTYDMATGKISGYDLNNVANPVSPSSYETSTEVWTNTGFVGRLNYRGDPTTLTFNNSGYTATKNIPNPRRFYFTYYTNGNSKTNRWREFFLVTRVKGLLHNGVQDDFSGINQVVAVEGGTVDIDKGAGPELALDGEQGYTRSGAGPIKFENNNDYIYKYKYQYIWVDVTVLITDESNNLKNGYYVTQFTATTPSSLHYTLQLIGGSDPNSNQLEPSAFYFGIENVVSNPFPYSNLITKNGRTNALTVGKLRYFSIEDSAKVNFSSNSGGSAVNFKLTASGMTPVTYYVVFKKTQPSGNPVTVTSASQDFTSNSQITISPIDGRETPANIIEGDIQIFVDENTYPMAGTYSSTIYCTLTQI